MRYIRIFVILFTIYLSLAGVLRVYADDSYFSVAGCDDPAKPCVTTGDGVNTIVPLTNTQQLIAQISSQFLGSNNIVMKLFGILKPLGSYNTGSEKLTTFANQVQNASDFELNPATLQTLEQHDETSKSASMTSRACVYDPQGNLISGDVVSSTTITTGDVPWIRPAVEGSRRLSSFTTGYVQESQDFRLPNITIKQDAALPCGSQLSGEDKKQTALSFQNQNTYGSSSTNTVVRLLYTLTSDLFKLFTGTKAPTAHIVGTGQNPFAGHADALTAGCATTSDLNSVSYATDEQKQKLCEAGGFVNSMYRQDAIDPTYKSGLNASDPTQQWDQTITNDQPVAPNSNAFAARVEAAGDYMNCTLLPAGYQGTAFPNGECNQNWAGTTSGLTAGGWNCDTSVPAQSVPGLIDSTLAQQKVNNWYYNCPNATANAWQQCANDVIATAKRSCVDPLFALLLWIHESGASNYQCGRLVTGGIPVEDFGIHSGNPQWPPENFSAQLDKFVLKPTEYVGLCPNLTFQNFMSLYAKGHCYNDLSQADKASVDNLINVDYKNLYEWFAPGVPLPTAWPGISDCTPG